MLLIYKPDVKNADKYLKAQSYTKKQILRFGLSLVM